MKKVKKYFCRGCKYLKMNNLDPLPPPVANFKTVSLTSIFFIFDFQQIFFNKSLLGFFYFFYFFGKSGVKKHAV